MVLFGYKQRTATWTLLCSAREAELRLDPSPSRLTTHTIQPPLPKDLGSQEGEGRTPSPPSFSLSDMQLLALLCSRGTDLCFPASRVWGSHTVKPSGVCPSKDSNSRLQALRFLT